MNRAQRRAQAAQLRAAKALVQKHEFPPGYIQLVERLAKLIREWCRAQPTTPELRFHDRGKILYAGSLGNPDAVKFLANSPDAFRLCAWLDEQTGRQATVFQVDCVLREMGAFDPPGEVKATGAGMATLTAFAKRTSTDTVHAPSPCGWCGTVLNTSAGREGHVPEPGHFCVCVRCAGLHRYGPGLVLERFNDEDLETLDPDSRSELESTRDLLRAARLQSGQNSYNKDRAEA